MPLLALFNRAEERGLRRARDVGSSMVEVILSVALLAIFTTSATVAVMKGTAATADNRARVTASGLAQRELELVGELITGSADGEAQVRAAEAINPHPISGMMAPAGLADYSSEEFPFVLDGERYRIVRTAARDDMAVAPCELAKTGWDNRRAPTVVTVTVTWGSMSGGTAPHVARKLFPPGTGSSGGLAAGETLLITEVEGIGPDGTKGPLANIEFSIEGEGIVSGTHVTDENGCAAVIVRPPSGTGASYKVTLLGHVGGDLYVDSTSSETPSMETDVLNGGQQPEVVKFVDYNLAIKDYTVEVTNPTDAVNSARVVPSGGGTPISEPLVSGRAVFPPLRAGSYTLYVGTVNFGMINLVSGAPTVKVVTLP